MARAYAGEQKESWQRALGEALLVLSVPPDEQVRLTNPGCLACELLNDFDLARSTAIEVASACLSPEKRRLLDRVDALLATMQGPDFVCFDNNVVRRPVWGELRALAVEALQAFGCEGLTVQPFVEVAPGVFRRSPSDIG
jgi:hypothetical protein